MIDVGAFLNASINAGAGFGTLIMAVATLMRTAPLYSFGPRSSARSFVGTAEASSAFASRPRRNICSLYRGEVK
jgi:hypothetical protein